MHHASEAFVSHVVAGGDAAGFFEVAEEVLDQMAPSVAGEVAGNAACTVGLGQDDGRGVPGVQPGADPVGVEGFVGNEGVEVHVGEERFDADAVVALPGQQNKAH